MHDSPPIARTDMRIPRTCSNCGVEEGTQRFLLTTGASGAAHTVVAWCQPCAEKVALTLLRAWETPFKDWTCERCLKRQSKYDLAPSIVTLKKDPNVERRICAECHHQLTQHHAILGERG
jgi:hypothetical protein